jgi:hypothetical protein
MRPLLAFATALTIFGGISPALAAPCRDAKGKFIKCATAAPAKATRCKNAKGKFAKCGTAGAIPIK